MTFNSVLWQLYHACCEGTVRCQKCKWHNQRTDGICCHLVDELKRKGEVENERSGNQVFKHQDDQAL